MFGKKELIKLMSIRSDKAICEQCHEEVRFQIIRGRYWFVVLFIPLIPMSTQYYLECPTCNTRVSISKEDAKKYLTQAVMERRNHTKKARE